MTNGWFNKSEKSKEKKLNRLRVTLLILASVATIGWILYYFSNPLVAYIGSFAVCVSMSVSSLASFKERKDLSNAIDDAIEANKELEEEVEGIEKEVNITQQRADQLDRTQSKLQKRIDVLGNYKDKITNYMECSAKKMEEQDEKIRDLLEARLEVLKDRIVESEHYILESCFNAAKTLNEKKDDEKMDKTEFEAFKKDLPQSMKERAKKCKFEDYDKNNDGEINLNEFIKEFLGKWTEETEKLFKEFDFEI